MTHLQPNVAVKPVERMLASTPTVARETLQMPEIQPLAAEHSARNDLPASLQEQLGLSGTELRVLLRLVAWGGIAREQAVTAAIKLSSMNVVAIAWRRKLAKHQIELETVHGFGWKLSREGREKILDQAQKRYLLAIRVPHDINKCR